MERANCISKISSARPPKKTQHELESDYDMAFARNWICFFPIGGEVVVPPKYLGLRGTNGERRRAG